MDNKRCSEENCYRPARTKGLCASHYQIQWLAAKNRSDAAYQLEHGYQKVIKKVPTNKVSYHSAHTRLNYYRGRAFSYQCQMCRGHAQEWSFNELSAVGHSQTEFIKDSRRANGGYNLTWSSNPADYDPLCGRCHRVRDRKHLTTDAREDDWYTTELKRVGSLFEERVA